MGRFIGWRSTTKKRFHFGVKGVTIAVGGNMRHKSLIFGLLAVAGLCGIAGAQNKVVKVVPAQPASTFKGNELYTQFCAACHGASLRGDGPAASALKTAPTDLTTIAKRNNGKFDVVRLRMLITGSNEIPAHGSLSMPVWGDVFKSISANRTFGEMRVNAIIEYLQQNQR